MKALSKKNILFSAVFAVIVAALIFLLLPDKSIAEAEPCAVGSCPNEITIADNGKILTYPVNRHFGVVLDRNVFPPNNLACATGNENIERTLSLKDLYPNQMERFLAKKPG